MSNGALEDSEEDFKLEVTDISHSDHIRSSQGEGLSPRQRNRRLVTTVGIVTLLLLVLALDLSGRLNLQQFLPKPPGPLTLRPQAQGMICLIDAAWSPQGTHIALLGDQHALYCPANTSGQKAGLVTVYDAISGQLVATLHPDDAVVRTIKTFAQRMAPASTPRAAQIAAAIAYQHVLWSPDGRHMALTFSLAVASIGLSLYLPGGEPENVHGVELLDSNGAHPEVILQVQSAYGPSPVEWDVLSGTIISSSSYPYPTFGMLMPALSYRWQTGATPVAVTPLSSVAPPPVPLLRSVGNPDGGSLFTIWQPGVVTGLTQPGPDGQLTHLAGLYELNSAFAAWSPDGRYLLDTVDPEGLLELPGMLPPTPDQLSAYGMDGVPFLPLHDAGLGQALRAVNPINPIGTYITWRPDGRVLAAYTPQNKFAVAPVTFYDSVTGRQLSSLLPAALGGDTSAGTHLLGQVTLLRWSPDGRHLLLYALPLGQVVILGLSKLS